MAVALYELYEQVVADASNGSSASQTLRGARHSLEEVVLERLREYASTLQGHSAENMYDLIIPQLERP